MEIGQILKGLGTAALNPLAFVAYLAAIGSWVLLRWKVDRNKNLLDKISALPESDRLIILRDEMGIEVVPGGFTAEQRIRSKIHLYYLLSFVVLCAVLVILFAIAKFSKRADKPVILQTVSPDPNIVQPVKVVPPSVQDLNRDLMETVDTIDLGVTKEFVLSKLGQPMHESREKDVSCIDFKLTFALLLFLIDSNQNVIFKYVIATDQAYKPRLMDIYLGIPAEKGCLGCFSFHDVTREPSFGMNPDPAAPDTPPEDTFAEIPPIIWYNTPAHDANTYVEQFDPSYSWHRTLYLVNTSDLALRMRIS